MPHAQLAKSPNPSTERFRSLKLLKNNDEAM